MEKVINSYDDKRIRYWQNDRNLGISLSRNKLIGLSRGEYLAVFDHDRVVRVCQRLPYFGEIPFEVEAFNRYAMFGNNNALSCLKGISPTAGQTVRENGINEYGNVLNWSLFWIKANPEDKALLVDHVLNIPER